MLPSRVLRRLRTLLLIVAMVLVAGEVWGSPLPVQLVRVVDGDTIVVELGPAGSIPEVVRVMPVRLEGIDTPEIRGKCDAERKMAQFAKEMLLNLIVGAKRIELWDAKPGKYFRLVTKVTADGKDVAEALLAAGLARRYEGGKRLGWCGD